MLLSKGNFGQSRSYEKQKLTGVASRNRKWNWSFHFLTKWTISSTPCKSFQKRCPSILKTLFPSPLILCSSLPPGSSSPANASQPELDWMNILWGMGTLTSTLVSGISPKGGLTERQHHQKYPSLRVSWAGDLQLVKDGIRWAAPILIVLMMNEVLWMVTNLAKMAYTKRLTAPTPPRPSGPRLPRW